MNKRLLNNRILIVFILSFILLFCFMLSGCSSEEESLEMPDDSSIEQVSPYEAEDESEETTTETVDNTTEKIEEVTEASTQTKPEDTEKKEETDKKKEKDKKEEKKEEKTDEENKNESKIEKTEISFNKDWKFADKSKIHDDVAYLYKQSEDNENRKNFTVCINAGHGTKKGLDVKTQCHPDGSPKVVSGTAKKGDTETVAVSEGMKFKDGTPEPVATLSMAKILKDELLKEGYDVLMMREDDDTNLDNIARTVIANNNADCHIAVHYDGTEEDRGLFFCTVPDKGGYRDMSPVKEHWEEHHKLGDTIMNAVKEDGYSLYKNGHYVMDLTQTSYSTIPSIDLEFGDTLTKHDEETQNKVAKSVVKGINNFVKEKQSDD